MKLDRAIAIQSELTSRVIDLISAARSFHTTSKWINEEYHKLFQRYPKDVPNHVREYVRGYRDALVESLYRHDLVHGYEWQGLVYTEYEKYPEELRQALRGDLATVEHGHYWKETLKIAGNQKPFFVQ